MILNPSITLLITLFMLSTFLSLALLDESAGCREKSIDRQVETG